MFHEHDAPARWHVWLAAIFLVAMLANTWLPELSYSEAVNALMAQELLQHGLFVNNTLMGQPTLHPPLASWCLAVMAWVLPMTELTVRLVSILSLSGLAIMCGVAGYRLNGKHAGAVSAAAAFSSFAAIEKGVRGEQDMLFCLLINAAWLTWYHLSRERRRWLYAWFFSHLLMCLAILAGGPKAVLFFYLPLFFLRRPLSPWRRIRQWDHWISLIFVIAVALLWMVSVPQLWDRLGEYLIIYEPQQSTEGYWRRLFRFPWHALWGFFPWIFLLWPTFCEAFRPLEKQPIFAQYLRKIVWSLFFLFWLIPDGKPGMLLPLIGPLSILVGMNYSILIRRHGPTLMIIGRAFAWSTFILCGAAVIIVGVTLARPDFLILPLSVRISSGVALVLAATLGLVVIRWKRQGPVWLTTVFSIIAFHLAISGTFYVYLYAYDSEQRAIGRTLQEYVPEDAHVYELISGGEVFASECFYLKRPVTRVNDTSELPRGPAVIYVLGEDRVPVSGDRDWSAQNTPIKYKNYWLRIWRGDRR